VNVTLPEHAAFTAELQTIAGNGRGRHLTAGRVGKLVSNHPHLSLHPI